MSELVGEVGRDGEDRVEDDDAMEDVDVLRGRR